jgi:DNA end-binding protein Ku
VKAYSASNSGSQIRLNQLCSSCHSRIRQKTVCPACGDLERSAIVKGYEYAKDQYVVIDLDELDKLRAPDEGKAIKIDTFVPPDQVDPIHFSESSYFLLPDGAAGQKPYSLLHRAMIDKSLTCVAKVVLHNKEQLVLIRPLDELLCMTVLRYASQVKSSDSEVTDAEYKLAATLIGETTTAEFDLGVYRDQYIDRLTKVIEAKVSGEEIVEAPSADAPNVINLMAALKASVAKAQAGGADGAVKASSESPTTAKRVAKTKKKVAKKKSTESLAKSLAEPGKRKKATTRKKRTG